MRIFNRQNINANSLKLIGYTPLVQLNKITFGIQAKVLVKLESFNPLGCVKERIALSMIEYAEKSGKLKKNMTVIEPTSGNTGIGLAFVCAVKGYKLILVMPDTMSIERRKIMSMLGAELILTPGSEGMTGAIETAIKLASDQANYFMPNQFENPANPDIHKRTTAREIWRDTNGKIDIFVAGVGTGGTITGCGEFLKRKNAKIRIIAVEPDESPALSGGKPGPHRIQGVGAGFIPKILNRNVIDEIVRVKSGDAIEMMKRLAKEEGIFAGISSGAAVKATIDVASRSENKGKTIVTILPDTGERYLSLT